MPKFHEVVYYNEGAVYKEKTHHQLMQEYTFSQDADPIFNQVKNDNKRYWVTEQFKAFFPPSDVAPAELEHYPLAPAVTLWLCVAVKEKWDQDNFDLFFAIDSAEALSDIADFYGLPNPSTDELNQVIDGAPETIAMYNVEGRPVVVGAVKYIDGSPTFLKLYTYPKDIGAWDLWMKGTAYYNQGKVWEEGGYFKRLCGGVTTPGSDHNGRMSDMTEVKIRSRRADGIRTQYRFFDAEADNPFIAWAGFESDGSKRVFEPSKYIYSVLGSFADKGINFEDEHDLSEASALWFARSHYGNPEEFAEVYFAATSSDQVKQVSDYYGLQTPLNETLAAELDSGNGRFRVRHYNFGDSLICINAGSVIFKQGVPIKILFYAFQRPWEYEDELIAPTHLI
jgi:hypothetical protein